MADTREFTNVNRTALDCLKQELTKLGVKPPEGDSGTVETQGVKVQVDYTEAQQKLRVTLLEKPFFLTDDLVWSLLNSTLSKCIAVG
jgi:hypothetical protein